MSQLLIFDWDGTLHDSIVPCSYPSTCRVFQEVGMPHPTFEEYAEHFASPVELFYSTRGVVLSSKEIWEIYNKHARHDLCACFPDVKATLELLKEMGLAIGVLSAQRQPILDAAMDRESLLHLFDFVHSEAECKATEIERLSRHHNASSIYHVGDLVSDVRDGLQAGAISVGITRGNPTRQVLIDAGAHHCIDHLNELIPLIQRAINPIPLLSHESAGLLLK